MNVKTYGIPVIQSISNHWRQIEHVAVYDNPAIVLLVVYHNLIPQIEAQFLRFHYENSLSPLSLFFQNIQIYKAMFNEFVSSD